MPDETPDRSEQGLPGSHSDQNAEEAPAGEEPERRPTHDSDEGDDDSAGGESGEGSQSTGHPDSAG